MFTEKERATLTLLSEGEAVDVLLAINCGELTGLECLCSLFVRRAHELLMDRFSLSQRDLLFRKMCGCGISPAAITVPPVPAPTSYVIPVINQSTTAPTTAPSTLVTEEPAAPTAACSTSLPASGSYTDLSK